MFSHLFRSRLFLSALVLSLIAVIGAYFGGKWYFGNFTEPGDESVKARLDAKDSPNTLKATRELAQPTDSQEQVENPNSIGEVSGRPESVGQDATTNTSDKTPLMGPITVDELWKLSPEEQKIALEAFDDFYREQFGVDPPPPGYQHIRDSKGTLHLHKVNEPFIEVGTRQGFAPTSEQANRLSQLNHDLLSAQLKAKIEGKTSTPEIQRLEAEIEQLRAEAVGERPDVSVFIFGYPGESFEEAMERMAKAGAEALERVYREKGLEHLIPEAASAGERRNFSVVIPGREGESEEEFLERLRKGAGSSSSAGGN